MRTLAAAVLLTALVISGCGGADPKPESFGDCEPADSSSTDNGGSGAGALVSTEGTDAPGGATSWVIVYCSEDRDGGLIEVSGTVTVPDGDAPEGGWPVVAFAHGTSGLGDQCAPSSQGTQRIPFIDKWIDAGYAVAASDYAGLGTDGLPEYLIGDSEARGVLDSVRAAGNFADANVGEQIVVVGYSQGGHAALWTGELAGSYAPELNIVGVAALAPPTDLVALLRDTLGDRDSFAAAAQIIASYAQYYDIDASGLLTDRGTAVVDESMEACAGQVQAQGAEQQFLTEPLIEAANWADLLTENSVGQAPIEAPVLIVQGGRDGTVPADVTRSALPQMCEQSDDLQYLEISDATHFNVGQAVVSDLEEFVAGAFAGDVPQLGEPCSALG